LTGALLALILAQVQPGLAVKDEGVAKGQAKTVNCSGAGITCSVAGGTWTISAGGGGGASWITGSKTWDPPSVDPGFLTDTTVTVAGAVVGDAAVAAFDPAPTAGMFLVANVTATNTVTVVLINFLSTPQDLATGTLTARVLH
jgi:hypothetical protein